MLDSSVCVPRDTPEKLAFMLDSLVRVPQQQRWKNLKNTLLGLSLSGSLGLVVRTWRRGDRRVGTTHETTDT